MKSLPQDNLAAARHLDTILGDINSVLREQYTNPTLTIFGDRSWSVEYESYSKELGKHRLCGDPSGDDMLSLVNFCRREL